MIVGFTTHGDVFAKKQGTHVHPFTISIPHSGQAGFLKIKPTFGQQSAQNIFLHLGHCHAVGFRNPPMGLPHTEQNPLTTASTVVTVCSYGILRIMVGNYRNIWDLGVNKGKVTYFYLLSSTSARYFSDKGLGIIPFRLMSMLSYTCISPPQYCEISETKLEKSV